MKLCQLRCGRRATCIALVACFASITGRGVDWSAAGRRNLQPAADASSAAVYGNEVEERKRE